MLTRLRPEPVLVPAFRGLLNRTYSARDTTTTTSVILFTFTRANLRGTAFKINQLHLATIATLANISVDKLTRFCRGVNSVDTCIVCRSGSLALVIFGEPRWSGTTCEAARSNRVKASIETNPGSSTCNVCTHVWTGRSGSTTHGGVGGGCVETLYTCSRNFLGLDLFNKI